MAHKEINGHKYTLPSLPKTTRGFGIHIGGTLEKRPRLAYANGKFVFIRYLDDQFDSDVFSGHRHNVNVAKFSPNGEWIASGDCKGNVIVWNAHDKTVKNSVIANTEILDICWGDDNSQIAAVGNGGDGHFARVFRIDSTNSIGEITMHGKRILSSAIGSGSPQILATASEDKSVNFYQGIPYRFLKKQKSHINYVNCVKYCAQSEKFVSVGSDRRIVFYDREGAIVHTISEKSKSNHKGSIYSCDFSADGKEMATSSSDKTVKIWDMSSYELKKTIVLGKDLAEMQVAVLWLGEYLVSVSLSGCLNFLDPSSDSGIKEIWDGHNGTLEAMTMDSSGSTLYTSGLLGKIVKWNLAAKTSSHFSKYQHGNSPIHGIELSSDDQKLYSIGYDDSICVSNVSEMEMKKVGQLKGQPTDLSVAKSHDLVAITTSKQNLYLIQNDSFSPDNFLELKFRPNCCAFGKDDSVLAVGGDDKKIHLYSVPDGNGKKMEIIREMELHKMAVTFVDFSPSKKYFVSVDKSRKTFLWDGEVQKEINNRGWTYHDAQVTCVCFNMAENRVVTVGRDEKVVVWREIDAGNRAKNRIIWPAHVSSVDRVQCRSDKEFFTMGGDRCVRCWGFE